MSKELAEKAAVKKRPATIEDVPPPKKYKGFTDKKNKTDRSSLSKVELPPKAEETTMVPFIGEVGLTTVVLLEGTEKGEE